MDPIERQRAAQSALQAAAAAALTFKQCAEHYVKAHRVGWKNAKHAQQWRNTLEQHAYPHLGAGLVRDVKLPQVMAVLEPIWTTTNETASRQRGRIEVILDWATARGCHKWQRGPVFFPGSLARGRRTREVPDRAAASGAAAPRD